MRIDCVRNYMYCYDQERGRRKDGRVVIIIEAKRKRRHDEGRQRRGFARSLSAVVCSIYIYQTAVEHT